ncbi:hypothetical protein KKH23_07820 [Patescibacteria group bacterium]|uniref:Uncharacterized protein n=1 Tax=viral metagenome TaxID=1070528 RepID=A0A6M3X6D0_9ZZZZ|nr:hypothetical protein [Patescibacteria group bacterium]
MIKILEFLYDLLVIGKTAAEDIKVSSDKRAAKNIREAVEEGDDKKLRKFMTKDFVLLDDGAIIGGCTTPDGKGVIISVDAAVLLRQLYKDLRRCRRSKK